MLDFGKGILSLQERVKRDKGWIPKSLLPVNCADGPIMIHVPVCRLPALCFEGS